MIGHVSIGVRDLASATRFYDACLSTLGYVRLYGTAKVSGYGPPAADAALDVFQVAAERRNAIPGFHVAFEAPSRSAVDAFHAAAVAAGGTDAGSPGLRPQYHDRYYAAYVIDLDGYKIEAVHQDRG